MRTVYNRLTGHQVLTQLLFSKYHWGVTSDRNPIKNCVTGIDYLTYIMHENYNNLCLRKFPITFSQGCTICSKSWTLSSQQTAMEQGWEQWFNFEYWWCKRAKFGQGAFFQQQLEKWHAGMRQGEASKFLILGVFIQNISNGKFDEFTNVVDSCRHFRINFLTNSYLMYFYLTNNLTRSSLPSYSKFAFVLFFYSHHGSLIPMFLDMRKWAIYQIILILFKYLSCMWLFT